MGGRSGQSRRGGGTGAGAGQDTRDVATEYPDINLQVKSGTFPAGFDALKAIQLTGLMKDFKGYVTITPSFGDTIKVDVLGNGLEMERKIFTAGGDKYIANEYFRIDDNSLYSGKSLEIFSRQVKNAAKSGFDRIKVSAAGDPTSKAYNGYYTWAAYGYQPEYKAYLTSLIRSKTGRNYGTWENMMKSKQGRADWKANGESWGGTFDLKKGSNSFKQLAIYTKDKKSKS